MTATLHHDSVDPAGFSPDIAMHALLCRVHDREGAVEMGYAATGYLRGIATALASRVGPEAARRAIRRLAEDVGAELFGAEIEGRGDAA